MRNEFFPTKKEAEETKKKLAGIESKVDELTLEKQIAERLIKDKLHGPDDEIHEHLLPQLEMIGDILYIRDMERALDLLALGYHIDTERENGAGVGEVAVGIADDLTDVALEVLKHDYPEVTREEATLVTGRTIDLCHPGKFFVDAFMEAIQERRAVMDKVPTISTYTVDGSGGVIINRKDE